MQNNLIPLGDASRDGLRAVWRGSDYVELRAGFAAGHYGESMHSVCRACLGIATDADHPVPDPALVTLPMPTVRPGVAPPRSDAVPAIGAAAR